MSKTHAGTMAVVLVAVAAAGSFGCDGSESSGGGGVAGTTVTTTGGAGGESTTTTSSGAGGGGGQGGQGGTAPTICGGPTNLGCADGHDCSVGADCLSGVCSGVCVAAQSYWVATTGDDANDGSFEHPWATIQHAADSVGEGTIVHVLPGSYAECIVSMCAGTEQARIRFLSEERWGALVHCDVSQTAAWDIGGDGYLDVVGFEVTGAVAVGIWNTATSHVRIIGNHVHDIPATGCDSNGGAGIDTGNYEGSDSDIIGNVVHDVGGDPTAVTCWRVHGIYHSNLRGRVANNLSYRNVGWGIHLWHAADEVTIVNNTVFANGYGGMIIGAGDAPGGVDTDNCWIANNVVFDNGIGPAPGGYGIEEYGNVGPSNRYLNNLVFQNLPDDYNLQGKTPEASVSEDPLFVDYSRDGTGDYRLEPTSPAVNAGQSDRAPSYDIDGGLRPVGEAWDIGAYEQGNTAATIWPFL